MKRGELTVQQLCDILEGQGVLSTQERIRVEGRSIAQRVKLEEIQASRSTDERRATAVVDAIDIVTSMGVPNAAKPGMLVSDLAIAEAIAVHCGLQLIRFTADLVDRELVAATLSRPFALRHCVMPVGTSGEALLLAVASPLDEDVLESLQRKSGTEVRLVISPKSDIRNAIHQVFPQPSEVPPPRTTVQPAQGKEPPRRAPGLPLWLILGGGAALVVAIGLLVAAAVWSARAGEPISPAEDPISAAASPSTASAGGRAAAAKAGPRGGDRRLHVRVTLRGVPPGAAISLDGERIDRSSMNVANDGRSHEIEVRAPGREPWLHTFAPTTDAVIDVWPVEAAPPSTAEPRLRATEPPQEAPPEPAAPTPLVREPGF
jgi:hypothetical protein